VAAKGTGWMAADHPWDAEPVDVPRHLASLRRSWGLIAAIVVAMSATVFLISSALPETYEATARIVMDDRAGNLEPSDVEAVDRRLATVRVLLTTRSVRARAARALDGESAESLEDKVSASVDQDANIVDVHAADGSAAGAAAIANAVARTFIARQRAADQRRVARTRRELQRALDRVPRNSVEAQPIQARLSELTVSAAAAGSQLVLAEPAEPPTEASSPQPVRNTILAFFAALFIGVLAVLGLGQLAPRVTGARDLASLTGAPILGSLSTSRLRRAGRLDDDAYQELQTALSLQLRTDAKIVVVAGALPGDRKAAVAAGLARSFAQLGSSTLLVSADVRRPQVHELFGLSRAPGLVELLDAASRNGASASSDVAARTQKVWIDGDCLDVLTAGGPAPNAARFLGSEAFSDLLLELESSDYDHVIVEGPALLGSVHGQLVGRHADALLVLCDPDHLTPGDAMELGELLRRLDPPVRGLVVLGRGGAGSMYPATITASRSERSPADV
jgi:Mrp family chromosome partitioning ATPase